MKPFDLAIRVPGSKSITNRVYALAALAEGESRITGALRADDTDRLLAALRTLGIESREDGATIVVRGGAGRLPRGGRVDLGDGGTPTRFVIALATLAREPVVVDGSPRMRERPVEEGIALLRELGARLEPGADGRLPVTVHPSAPLRGGRLDVGRTQSSQFLSALLLIAPMFAAPLALRYREPPTSASYLELTVSALGAFGIPVTVLRGADGALLGHDVAPQAIRAADVVVEADASSAVYFGLAAALVPGSRVRLEGLPRASRQPDLAFFEALSEMGATVRRDDDAVDVAYGGALRPIDVDAARYPDAAMALAIACAVARGRSRITGLSTLRVKESDRISALATELTRIGCACAVERDALVVDSTSPHDRPASIATYRDHRMAMSFGVLALVRPGLTIEDPACVNKSYPGFWEDVARLRR